MPSTVVGVVLDGRGEEGIDESGLAESRLTSDLWEGSVDLSDFEQECAYHDREGSAALRHNFVSVSCQYIQRTRDRCQPYRWLGS